MTKTLRKELTVLSTQEKKRVVNKAIRGKVHKRVSIIQKPVEYVDLETGEIISKKSFEFQGGTYENFGEKMKKKREMFESLRVEVQDFLSLLLKVRREDPQGRFDLDVVRNLHCEKTGMRFDNSLRLVESLKATGILDRFNDLHPCFLEPLGRPEEGAWDSR